MDHRIAGKEEYQVIKDKDGFDLLEIQPHETVSLIGGFGPYIHRLKGWESLLHYRKESQHVEAR